jgi:type VI protein secretion system component Hcp
MQAEMLEVRQLLSAILLEIPGVNGDAKAAGATSNDIQLDSFSWEFKRQPSSPGTRATTADPLVTEELSFTKPGDSASNALFAQANFSPLNVSGSKLRIVDDTAGKNLFSFDLTNARLTEFGVQNGSSESGALSFSKINLTDTSTATNRIASWDLLTGSATSSAIAGPGNIDIGPSSNPLNIETVLEIGGQKLLINSFEWGATNDATLTAAGRGKGLTFKMERGVDTGTAGLLGSAAKGTVFDKISITDRKEIDGKNQIVMEWHLYNAFLTDFGLNMEDGENGDAPINSLGWSYSKIGVVERQILAEGKVGVAVGGWDEQANKAFAPSVSGGPVQQQPAIKAKQNVSFLKLDGSGAAGEFLYETIDWSVSPTLTFSDGKRSLQTTSLGELNVTYPNSGQAVSPLLISKLYGGTTFQKVDHKEANEIEPFSPLNDWSVLHQAKGMLEYRNLQSAAKV